MSGSLGVRRRLHHAVVGAIGCTCVYTMQLSARLWTRSSERSIARPPYEYLFIAVATHPHTSWMLRTRPSCPFFLTLWTRQCQSWLARSNSPCRFMPLLRQNPEISDNRGSLVSLINCFLITYVGIVCTEIQLTQILACNLRNKRE